MGLHYKIRTLSLIVFLQQICTVLQIWSLMGFLVSIKVFSNRTPTYFCGDLIKKKIWHLDYFKLVMHVCKIYKKEILQRFVTIVNCLLWHAVQYSWPIFSTNQQGLFKNETTNMIPSCNSDFNIP